MNSAPTRIDLIDVCVVATRRPELLERTLRSFHDNLFKAFKIRRIIANIDPRFGSISDQNKCIALIRSYDPDALIRVPELPNFAKAVAANWLASSADVILHLEDDWLLDRPVNQEHLQPFVDYKWIGQISFNHANKRWDVRRDGPFCYARKQIKLLNMKFSFGPKRQTFLTGPSFLRGTFARRSAELMDPAFDPEKQFCRGLNRQLECYVADYRNLVIGDIDAYYIQDIGRQWRKERTIRKKIVGGQSYWTVPAPKRSEERIDHRPIELDSREI